MISAGSWILCGKVFKAMWSEELSDKFATIIYVWNKELHINMRLNHNPWTDNSLEHPAALIVLKFQG